MKTTRTNELNFYIGSNNDTKKVEISKIEKHFNTMFKGYSLYKGVGLWETMKENSVLVKVFTKRINNKDLMTFTENIKKDLKQYSIILTKERKNLIEV